MINTDVKWNLKASDRTKSEERRQTTASEERTELRSAPLFRGGRKGRCSKGDWERTSSKVGGKPRKCGVTEA